MQTIHLDISTKRVPTIISAKQGDVGRKFKAIITDNGDSYNIPDGALLSAWYCGTSGEGNYTAIGEKCAFRVKGDTVEVELITQMLSASGGGVICLVMNCETGEQIGFWNIPYTVEPVPGLDSPKAEENFTAYAEKAMELASLVHQATEAAKTFRTDATLSEAEVAADAQAVGEALSKLVPLDCGLGGWISKAQTLATVNNAQLTTGFYMCTVNTEGIPDGWGGGPLFVMAVDENRAVQTIYSNNLSQHCVRSYLDGVWEAWEYNQPPMAVDVEYRTTERRNKKPVYTMLVNCGQWEDEKVVYVTLSGAGHPFRFDGSVNGYVIPFFYNDQFDDASSCKVNVVPWENGLRVSMGGGTSEAFAGAQTYVQVWYTK